MGKEFTHAETRKSPVVDGVVRRNTEGKEIRFITRLTDIERTWAAKICEGFGQRVCGFDMLRCGTDKSQVIDVNGWSFVKGNDSYYGKYQEEKTLRLFLTCFPDRAAEILAQICVSASSAPDRPIPAAVTASETWLLKANVTVLRHVSAI